MESESQISDFPEYRKTGVQARFGLVGAVVLEARDAVGGGVGRGVVGEPSGSPRRKRREGADSLSPLPTCPLRLDPVDAEICICG